MRWSRLLAAALLGAAACSTTTLPPPIDSAARGADAATEGDREFPTQVRIERRNLTCRAATRAARAALKRMSYGIEQVTPPEPGRPGEIRGYRRTGSIVGDSGDSYRVAIRIECDDQGSVFSAATEEPLSARLAFTRDLPGEIDRAASRGKPRRPAERASAETAKLQVSIEPLRGASARAQIGANPESVGVMPVHVRIVNRSQLTYRFTLDRLQLITEERTRHAPIAIDEVAAAVAPEWADHVRQHQIGETAIAPGDTLEGYLYVPPAAYRKAKVVLIDTASEEAEGFSVEF